MGICTTIALTFALSSMHLTHNYNTDYNEVNPGVSIECNQYAAGVFQNSLNKTSVHAGMIFKHNIANNLLIGSNVGMVTGYQDNAVPFVRPFVQYRSLRLGYIPESEEFKSESTITVEYSISF